MDVPTGSAPPILAPAPGPELGRWAPARRARRGRGGRGGRRGLATAGVLVQAKPGRRRWKVALQLPSGPLGRACGTPLAAQHPPARREPLSIENGRVGSAGSGQAHLSSSAPEQQRTGAAAFRAFAGHALNPV